MVSRRRRSLRPPVERHWRADRYQYRDGLGVRQLVGRAPRRHRPACARPHGRLAVGSGEVLSATALVLAARVRLVPISKCFQASSGCCIAARTEAFLHWYNAKFVTAEQLSVGLPAASKGSRKALPL